MQLNPPWLSDPVVQAVIAALGVDHVRFVGGCVRDACSGKVGTGFPSEHASKNKIDTDLDLATDLTPDVVTQKTMAAGLKAVPTGIDHGTVTVVSAGRGFEVTTLRADVATDGRRAVVAFTTDWAVDAQRRDFHLNALYMDASGTVYDPTGHGIADAQAGRVVFIGDAHQRIAEDYLRILRFFRFHAHFGHGTPDPAGLAACAALKDGLTQISAERIAHELLKLLAAHDPMSALRAMADAGVLGLVLPEARLPDDLPDAAPIVRLACLLPDDQAGAAAAARLKLSSAHSKRLIAALGLLDIHADEQTLKTLIYRAGAQTVADRALRLNAPHIADFAAQWPVPVFPLTGADAAALGIAKGPGMGAFLRGVEDQWIAAGFPERDVVLRSARILLSHSNYGN